MTQMLTLAFVCDLNIHKISFLYTPFQVPNLSYLLIHSHAWFHQNCSCWQCYSFSRYFVAVACLACVAKVKEVAQFKDYSSWAVMPCSLVMYVPACCNTTWCHCPEGCMYCSKILISHNNILFLNMLTLLCRLTQVHKMKPHYLFRKNACSSADS